MKRTAPKNFAAHEQAPDLDETTSVTKEGDQGLPSKFESDMCEVISCKTTTAGTGHIRTQDFPILSEEDGIPGKIEKELPVSEVATPSPSSIVPGESAAGSTPTYNISPKTSLKRRNGKFSIKRKHTISECTLQQTRAKFVELAEVKLDICKNKLERDQYQTEKQNLEIAILKEKLEYARKENIKIDLETALLKKKNEI